MIQIRNSTKTDAEALWAIHFDTIRHINSRDYSPKQIEAWAPEVFDLLAWEKRLTALSPFVAEINGIIVGYADLQGNGLIDHFFCHHEYQKQGVGKGLMFHIHHMALQRNIKRLYSEVSITARPFYEDFGFKVIQTQYINIRGHTLKNFMMEKTTH